jgi:hypothetical protein
MDIELSIPTLQRFSIRHAALFAGSIHDREFATESKSLPGAVLLDIPTIAVLLLAQPAMAGPAEPESMHG